jgi:hypothetical protein
MKAGSSNKHKAHRSAKKQGYYKNQFTRTAINKLRRKQRIERRKKMYPQAVTTSTTSLVLEISKAA